MEENILKCREGITVALACQLAPDGACSFERSLHPESNVIDQCWNGAAQKYEISRNTAQKLSSDVQKQTQRRHPGTLSQAAASSESNVIGQITGSGLDPPGAPGINEHEQSWRLESFA